MELERTLNLPDLLSKKSFFLLGPRATGKSTLVKQQLSKSAAIPAYRRKAQYQCILRFSFREALALKIAENRFMKFFFKIKSPNCT